jgi:predicted TIM-barrel fold metal-dependent hydrolase
MSTSSMNDFVMSRGGVRRKRRLLGDLEPGPIKYPLISVDDHLLEPRETFEGRLPRKYAESGPRVIEDDDGMEWWLVDGQRIPNSGGNASSGWDPGERYLGPVRYDEVRRATYDVHERVRDMDLAGVIASLCFPSMIWGFCGQRFSTFKDPDHGLVALRAYNDWLIEDWVGAYPDRFIPSQLPWLADPLVAADEIRRNAARGFKAVSFSENPERLGYPSVYTSHWDPFFLACEETETVVNLHVGSSSQTLVPSTSSPPHVIACLFPVNALAATSDWLFACIPLRFPKIKIVMSESGIGFVPMLLDRLEYTASRFYKDNDGGLATTWTSAELSPAEALQRNFWFTAFYDPLAFHHIERIGVGRVMMEVDYPHQDSTWPDTQDALAVQLDPLSPEVVHRLTIANAADVYRHPVPSSATALGR